MADTTHDDLLGILRKLPSDFEPWGQRSREDDWGPDCSCGCRWFIRLQADLNLDWGVCSNPGSPRCGLLTFEHQGCREFEESEVERRADFVRRLFRESLRTCACLSTDRPENRGPG